MRITRGSVTWAKRVFVAVVLVGAAVIPGRANSQQPERCAGVRCSAAGSILWSVGLPGLWLTEPGVSGTVPAKVGAYAAIGGGLAVLGAGTAVSGFDEATGKRLWRVAFTTLPAGSAIVGVRAFAGVVAVGVTVPPGQSITGQPVRGRTARDLSGATRYEIMLSGSTGRQIRIYPAASYGGAVAATSASTVVVGTQAITAYDNATGRVRWSWATGPGSQTWRVSGDTIYATDGRGSRGAGSTELLWINLNTGVHHVVRLASGTILGSLSDAIGNVVLFSGADGVQAFNGITGGKPLWSRPGAELELAGSGDGIVYLVSGNRLIGVNLATHLAVSSAPISVAASLYWETGGVALGLDQSGLGEAWGYNLRTRRIVWTSGSLPWPHFFVDLSGLGGSASSGSTIALLATCAQVGAAQTANSAPVCRRPVLDAIRI